MEFCHKLFQRSIQFLILFTLAGAGCGPSEADMTATTRLSGKTMGTSYNLVVAQHLDAARLQQAIDSLLIVINQEVSTYEPASLITNFNTGDTLELPLIEDVNMLQRLPGAHFAVNLQLAADPYAKSGGFFDPTVGPLVEYYGFGKSFSDTSAIDTGKVGDLLKLVGFHKVRVDTVGEGQLRVSASTPGVALDFSAIAKGYGVDQLALLLEEDFKVKSYFVEIGGETRSAGNSPRGTPWRIAINTPDPSASIDDIQTILTVSDLAIATSGNYRNMRIRGGEQLVHTVDPHTGKAIASRLLSATVLAPTCAIADAYATACMASGGGAPEVLAKAGLAACLIYAGENGEFVVEYVGDFDKYVLKEIENSTQH